ncbi:cysteine proteinase, partial [Clavulina sp. PMI_390]
CEHIAELLADESRSQALLQRHAALIRWGAKERLDGAATERPHKRRKVCVPECNECGHALSRPFVCLECSSAGCWHTGHIADHLERTGHDFALDVSTGSVFCAPCDDLIYHEELERAYNLAKLTARRKKAKVKGHNHIAADLLAKLNCGMIILGRKGFLNLGATCYLNVVLQAVLHNPLIKNWFMSDKHPHQLCSRAVCMSCEMDRLVTEIYSKDPNPIAPTLFLQTLWRTSDEIAGYAQQDAHEVLVTILNAIHTTHMLAPSSSSSSASSSSSNQPCYCPIHMAFGAQLQSDVTCGKCTTKKSTVDPLLDVSLELNGAAGAKENTLIECLRRYTRSERLGPKDQVMCQKCRAPTENATRQLSIKKLPPVLCFQFKRFEHSTTSTQKIDAPVRYPSTIDMAPFTSYTLHDQKSSDAFLCRSLPDDLYAYDLFAVINHEGQMDTGHYTAYARSRDLWHKFDDDKVTYASLGEALSTRSKAYMCFYVRKQLDY